MDKKEKMSLGWRLFWAVVGAILSFTILSIAGLGLSTPLLIVLSLVGGLLVGLLGPSLLDLLTLVP